MGYGARREIYIEAYGAQKYPVSVSDDNSIYTSVRVDRDHSLKFLDLRIVKQDFFDPENGEKVQSVYTLRDGDRVLKTLTLEFRNGEKVNEYTSYGDI